MERKEVLLSDLGHLLTPQSAIADDATPTQWRRVSYETTDFSGSLVSTTYLSEVPSLTLEPKLSGWYKIFLGLNYVHSHGVTEIQVQLSGDRTYVPVRPDLKAVGRFDIDEFFWKCADMTDQSVIFHQPPIVRPHNSSVAFVRFVPMTDEEVAAYFKEKADPDTKRVYATDDIHNILFESPRSIEYFLSQVEQYRDSDVKALSMEYIRHYDFSRPERVDHMKTLGRITEKYAAETTRWLHENNIDYLAEMIKHGHDVGIDMYLSMRMNSVCYSYPLDENFYCEFFEDHQELHQQDRDGVHISRFSYAFEGTRQYALDTLRDMAKYDCDGVDLIYNRGYPFVLFEEPFLELVRQRYGVDARTLPNDDERLMTVRCQIMTDFMRQVKKQLAEDRAARGQKPLKIAVHVHKSIRACRFVGLDLEAWVKEGLIDSIECYPVELEEHLPDECYANEEKTLIDVDKYRQAVAKSPVETHPRIYNTTDNPEEDTLAFVNLVKGTDVKLYIDILPRTMSPEEFRKRGMRLYNYGVHGVSLWDTYDRTKVRRQWTMMSRLGHHTQLPTMADGDGELFRTHRVVVYNRCRMDRYPPYWAG